MKKRIRVLSAVLAAVLAVGSLAGGSRSGSAGTTAAAAAERSGSGRGTGFGAGSGKNWGSSGRSSGGGFGANSFNGYASKNAYASKSASPASVPAFGKQFSIEKADSLDYQEGDRVRHIKFGCGTVKTIKDGGKDYEVTVEFDSAGVKKMFASFAKLKKLTD